MRASGCCNISLANASSNSLIAEIGPSITSLEPSSLKRTLFVSVVTVAIVFLVIS